MLCFCYWLVLRSSSTTRDAQGYLRELTCLYQGPGIRQGLFGLQLLDDGRLSLGGGSGTGGGGGGVVRRRRGREERHLGSLCEVRSGVEKVCIDLKVLSILTCVLLLAAAMMLKSYCLAEELPVSTL